MKKTIGSCCLLLSLWTATTLSQSRQPRFERPLIPSAPGANRISPDVSVLSGAAYSDLRDLRFYDAAGKEIPYLLIPPESPAERWISGRILPIAATKTTSGFEADLGSSPRVDTLRLTGIPAPFLKRYRLEGSGDRSHWTLLIEEGTLFDLPGENLRLTDMSFTTGEFRYLRVTWDDGKSGVVPQPRDVSARAVRSGAPPAPLRANIEVQRLSAATGRSRFQLRLPGPHLPLAAIELNVDEPRLLRAASVTESKLSGGQVMPQTLGSATLRRVAQGDLIAADLRIPIRAPEGREIEILVEDGNNSPLNLTGVVLEFVPQPWIYIESPAGDPLTVRYGDPKLTAPRYDLEAMRQYVGRTDLKEARWGDVHDLEPAQSAADGGIQPQTGAAIDPKPFRYSRKIPNSMPGLTALVLDASVLAHSRSDLGDLRITDAGNRQVPYLLERRPDDLVIDLPPLVRETGSGAQSHYRITLPFENLPAAKLVLNTTERVFQRNVSLQGAETLAGATWRHADPDTTAPPLILNLPATLRSGSVTVVVDEGDNRPLPVTGVRLELPFYRVRFFYPADGKLNLLYGQDGLAAPRYDLELIAPRLVGLATHELTLDKEDVSSNPLDNKILQGRIFWGALILAVVVILFLLARLLRSEKRAT